MTIKATVNKKNAYDNDDNSNKSNASLFSITAIMIITRSTTAIKLLIITKTNIKNKNDDKILWSLYFRLPCLSNDSF